MTDARVAAAWEDEGRRIATELGEARAVVVTGDDVDALAAVAWGLVAAHAPWRRVAVGDLAGRVAALERRAVAEPGLGLADVFTDGRPLSDVAVALRGLEGAFLLPSGADASVVRRDTARWRKLASGFRAMDALLVLVVPLGAPEVGALCDALDGAVVVGVNPARVRHLRVVATADGPDLVAGGPFLPSPAGAAADLGPSVRAGPTPASAARRRPRRALAWIVAGAAIVAAGVWWSTHRWDAAAAAPVADAMPGVEERAAPPAPPPPDTVTIPDVINPADSARAAAWGVELVATSTVTDANLVVQQAGPALPAPTVVATDVGRGGARFYRVVAGATADRDEAAALLAALRHAGVAPRGTGAVTHVPLAFALEAGVSREAAPAVVGAYIARGVPAYALLQDDGTATVYAGAFATPAQSARLLVALRARGLAPRLAFRLGRPL